MRDRESRRRPAPYHECRASSDSDRNTNRTFVAVRTEGTWLHTAIQVLPLPAHRMRVLEVHEIAAQTEPCRVRGLHSALHRDMPDLWSSDSRLTRPTRTGRLLRSWCPRLELLSLKLRNKSGRGSHSHAPSSARSRRHPESCA